MARVVRVAAVTFFTPLIIVGIAAWSAYTATQQAEPFYSRAIECQGETAALESASRELETQAGALYSDAQHGGPWRAVFTAEQMNAWLALQLERNYADLIPPKVWDPRVAISPDLVTLAFRSQRAGIDTVISIRSQVFLSERNVVAVRLKSVRAGALPLPVGQVAHELRLAAKRWAWPVRWTRLDGDVVALIEVSPGDDDQFVIERIELHEGELYLAGTSRPSSDSRPRNGPKIIGEYDLERSSSEPAAHTADQSGIQSSRQ